MSQEPTKPLVIKCRVTLPKGLDLLSFYRRFTEGKFTVLQKGDLVPKRDGTGDNFYMDLFIWPDEGSNER
jgi:hypothetical protein